MHTAQIISFTLDRYQSDTRLLSVYIPSLDKTKVVRSADFHETSEQELPRISTLVEGIPRQAVIDSRMGEDTDGRTDAESLLIYAMTVQHYPNTSTQDGIVERRNENVLAPGSFSEAQRYPEWTAAIDKEYDALVSRNTWAYVGRTDNMNVIPFLWTFRVKYLDTGGHRYKCKGRCITIGDLQLANLDLAQTDYTLRSHHTKALDYSLRFAHPRRIP